MNAGPLRQALFEAQRELAFVPAIGFDILGPKTEIGGDLIDAERQVRGAADCGMADLVMERKDNLASCYRISRSVLASGFGRNQTHQRAILLSVSADKAGIMPVDERKPRGEENRLRLG